MALSLGAAGDREEPICSALCVEAFNACEDLRGDFSNQKLVLLPHSDVALCRAEGGEVWDDVIRGTAPDVLRTLQSRLPIRLLCEYDTNMGLYIYDTVLRRQLCCCALSIHVVTSSSSPSTPR